MVCVNYSDFLKYTLPYNKHNFDNIIVVTISDDINTQKVCNDNGVKYVITNRLYEDGAKFNKGKAINDGIKLLNKDGWVILTDSDMIYPKNFRELIDLDNRHPKLVFGTDRIMCSNYEEWVKYNSDVNVSNSWIRQGGRSVGVGFFQMVHCSNPIIKGRSNWLSEDYGHAGRSDRIFWRSFKKRSRRNIGVTLIHLDTEPVAAGYLGKNWHGRKTKLFGELQYLY